MIRTSFYSAVYSAVQHAPVLEAYANNPAIRRGDTRLADMPGDQAKVVAVMIEVAGFDDPVGAENLCTSRDLGVLVDQPTETIVP